MTLVSSMHYNTTPNFQQSNAVSGCALDRSGASDNANCDHKEIWKVF
jgi:hypothetical protein